MNDILVIIVTWNSSACVGKCLESLRTSSVPVDALVVDNGSSDGTAGLIRKDFPEVAVIEAGDNLGFGRANNIGFRYALERPYDYVYLLNSDAWLEKDTLERMLEDSHGFDLMSPVQKSAGGSLDPNFEARCGKYVQRGEVPFVMAAHWLIPRRTLETVGGFSPAFAHYGEDDNWIHRLHWHGMRCGIVSAASAVHDRGSREMTKGQRMRLKCVAAAVKVSDPGACLVWRLVREPLELIGMSVKNLSLIPLCHIPELIKRYPELIRFRTASRQKGAFL